MGTLKDSVQRHYTCAAKTRLHQLIRVYTHGEHREHELLLEGDRPQRGGGGNPGG